MSFAPRECLVRTGRDLRYAVRGWRKTPGVTLTAVLSLTLTQGAATAVFTLCDGLLWRALPVAAPHELHAVAVPGQDPNLAPRYFSYPFYRHLREVPPPGATFIASSVAVSPGITVRRGKAATRLRAELVSGNYFQVLGVGARLGRLLTDDDDRVVGAHPVVVLSYPAWQRTFGGRGDIVGQTLQVNGTLFSVVGVAAEGFFGTRRGFTPDVWAPIALTAAISAAVTSPTTDTNYLELIARVAPATAVGALEGTFAANYDGWRRSVQTVSGTSPPTRFALVPAGGGLSLLRGQYAQALAVLLAMVVTLVAIAYANVTNLVLARSVSTRKERAVRASLGATGGDLAWQSLINGAVLAGGSGLLAWAAAIVMGRAILSYVPTTAADAQFSPGVRTVLFIAMAAALATVLFGVAQSRTRRGRLAEDLKRASAGAGGAAGHVRIQTTLTVLQVALSLVLVAASLVLGRSLSNLWAVDPGFHRENVFLATLDPGKSGYPADRVPGFYDRVLERLRAVPRVQSAALASHGSLSGLLPAGTRFVNTSMHAEGHDLPPDRDATVYLNVVTPGYFGRFGPTLLRGRDFSSADRAEGTEVAVINEAAAAFFFGDIDPIGKRIAAGRTGPGTMEVVGLVRDAKYLDLREPSRRTVYRPFGQAPRSLMTLHVRTAGDPGTLVPLAAREIQAIDPAVPLFQVQTMRHRIDDSLQREHLMAALGRALGTLGALLAMVGLFAVVNYTVAQRTREIALRMALGATPGLILATVVRRTAGLALIGIVVGVPVALFTLRAFGSFLYGVTGSDPGLLSLTAALLIVMATTAGLVPAWRASRVDPVTALRQE